MKNLSAEDLKKIHEAQEVLPFVLQLLDKTTGQWVDFGKPVRGKTHAQQEMNELKRRFPGDWRYIPKNEADKFREGVNIGIKIGMARAEKALKREEERPRQLPLMALPDHL